MGVERDKGGLHKLCKDCRYYLPHGTRSCDRVIWTSPESVRSDIDAMIYADPAIHVRDGVCEYYEHDSFQSAWFPWLVLTSVVIMAMLMLSGVLDG